MSAVAHDVGTSGYMTRARNAHAQVAFSNSPLTDSQSIPSMLWKAMPTAKRTPSSMPMLSRLSRLILSGGTSSTPVAVASSPRSVFSALPWCLTPLVRPAGSAAGWTTGMIAAGTLLAERGDHRRDGALVAHELGAEHEERSVVAVHPVLLAARVGRAEVVERDRRPSSVDDDAQAVEVAVGDPRRVQCVELLPRRGEHRIGDTLGGKRTRWACRRGGVVTSTAASAPPTPVRTRRAARTSARSASISVKRDVLDLLDPAAEHGHAGVVVHRLVPHLRGDAGVALVAPERVDPQVFAGGELDVHHRGALDVSRSRARCSRRRSRGR